MHDRSYVMCFCLRMELLGVFVFQAEDGIRDLVRSRGLGDVYKRQVRTACHRGPRRQWHHRDLLTAGSALPRLDGAREPVSYTHLTLPTSDLV